jgi:hypothetical protein
LTRWAPGFYTVSLVINFPELSPWITNEVPFALAPIIKVSPLSAPPGDLALRVTCSPRIRVDQRVTLLFGPQQIPVAFLTTPPDTSLPTTLEFFVPDVKAGSYVIRLRVDGVDSLPIGPMDSPSGLVFDPGQRVTVA